MAGWAVPGVVHLRQLREDPVGRRVLARHRITRKALAITYLAPELRADAEFRARFAGECARLSRIRQAGVARVYQYLDCEHGAAVIGEHINGTTLRSLLLTRGAISTEAALVMFKDLLQTLSACHQAGLAHGDVKPDNVILSSAGRARLLDFGLWTVEGRRRLTQSTPFYLAPEQWSGAAGSLSSGDVYAATVTFFECLVGAPPFYARDAAQLSAKHRGDPAPVEVLPETLRDLVVRGLAKDPAGRADARSLLAAVAGVAARAVEPGWERRGRRELMAHRAQRKTIPDLSAVSRRISATGQVGYRRNIRLAAVLGGALALAAGLSSPPLAVIPGIDIFGSSGRPPVLAFPEPDRGPVAMRVVTNGRPADRAATPAVKVANGRLSAGARPPSSVPETTVHTGPYDQSHPDTLQQRPASAEGADQSLPDRSTLNLEQQKPTADKPSSDPLQVSFPVALPAPLPPADLPVQLPAPVQLPLPVQAPQPIQDLKSILNRDKTGAEQKLRTARSFSSQADSEVSRKMTMRGDRPDAARNSYGPPRTLSQRGSDSRDSGRTGTR